MRPSPISAQQPSQLSNDGPSPRSLIISLLIAAGIEPNPGPSIKVCYCNHCRGDPRRKCPKPKFPCYCASCRGFNVPTSPGHRQRALKASKARTQQEIPPSEVSSAPSLLYPVPPPTPTTPPSPPTTPQTPPPPHSHQTGGRNANAAPIQFTKLKTEHRL